MPSVTVTRSQVRQRLEDKSVDLAVANQRGLPAEAAAGVKKADLNRDGKLAGRSEIDAAFKALDHFDRNGKRESFRVEGPGGPTVAGGGLAALEAAAERVRPGLGSAPAPSGTPPAPSTPAGPLSEKFAPNAEALSRAEKTDLGRTVSSRTSAFAGVYEKASTLTGVPPALIAALHANESGVGQNRASVNGPESGFGLDPRGVTTSWGNKVLKQHGLGTWQRGKNTETGRLQAAVIAAEHLKRMGTYVGAKVGPDMTRNDLAGAITAYTAGIHAGKRAKQTGKSWMFDPSDSNPLPNHPGGTSVGPGGRRTRVGGGRKPGLLRWDVLVPLVERQLPSATRSAQPAHS